MRALASKAVQTFDELERFLDSLNYDLGRDTAVVVPRDGQLYFAFCTDPVAQWFLETGSPEERIEEPIIGEGGEEYRPLNLEWVRSLGPYTVLHEHSNAGAHASSPADATVHPETGNRLTVPVNTSIQVDLDDAGMIPVFPANLGTPRISWYPVSGGIETMVFLHKDGRRCLTFLTAPTADGGCESAFQQDIGSGEKLTSKEQQAVAGWFEVVGALLFNAYRQIAEAVTDSDSAAYRAVTAYATGTGVTGEHRIRRSMADVLAKHQYRPGDRSCSCDENWYDSRADHSRDMEEHFVHVEIELTRAGFGNTAEARALALEEASEAIDGDADSSFYNKRRSEVSGPYSKPMHGQDSAELDGIESAAGFIRSLAADARQRC